MTEYAFEGVTQASTTVTWSFAAQTYAADDYFPFSAVIAAPYQSTVQAAFARWAAISGITFVQTPDSRSDGIRIGFGAFYDPNEIGETAIPLHTPVFTPDTVIRLLDPRLAPLSSSPSGYTFSDYGITLYQVALHEIGHALGLDHTSDPATTMYPVASALNTDLAAGDIDGINALYPLYTVATATPVQVDPSTGTLAYNYTVTRFSDPASTLVVDYAITGAADPALAGTVAASGADFAGGTLPSGTLTFAAGSTTATLTVAVPGTTAPRPDQSFTLAITSATPGVPATTRGATVGVILDANGYSAIGPGALGIYRFFDAQNGTHFFTASQAERNALITARPDMTYEGVDLTAVAAPAADPAATAVYRFFDATYGTHFYTASAAERDAVLATRHDLSLEGIAFSEHTTQQPGDAPVYRFFDTLHGTHFYTSSVSESATILATRPDLIAEGTAFYAPRATVQPGPAT